MAKIVRRLSSWASFGTGTIPLIRDRREDAAAIRTAAAFRHEKLVRKYRSEDEGLTVPSECGWTAQCSSEEFAASPTSWTMHEKIAVQISPIAPLILKQAEVIAGLPRELWAQILAYVEDQRDLFRIARVSRTLRTIASEALTRHTFRLETTNAITTFSDALAQNVDLAHAIQHLFIRCVDERIPPCLPLAFRKLCDLRSLAVHVDNPTLALACAQRGLFHEPLPHLTTFSTSLPCTIQVLDFVQTHGTIEELTITDDAIDPGALGPKLPLPSLRILTCRMEFLQCFSRSPTLTHLYVTLYVEGALKTLVTLLGAQLVSLQLGLNLRDCDRPGESTSASVGTAPGKEGRTWSPAELLSRFPRLRYLQLRALESNTNVWSYPIDWNASPFSPSSLRLRPGLVLAFVFERELLTDLERRQTVAGVLRSWAPHVARVLYGHAGRPDTSCVMREEGAYIEERRMFGEGYWKEV